MSYIYLQEREGESLEECSSDIPQFALWKLNPTAEKSYSSDSETESCPNSQSGTTCEPSTGSRGAGELMSSAEDSHARTLAAQERAQELTENEADYGEKWRVSFAKWNRVTCSWKIAHCLHLAGLDEFLETWPKWGMMQDGECWEQMTLAHRTEESEYGFWPTPRSCSAMAATITPESAHAENRFPNLETVVGGMMWPTPTCHNAKEQDSPAEATRNTPSLCHIARGGDATQPRHLNPAWVEWLMGWPIGWTDLKPLETDKFQQWLRSHGKR